MSETPQKGLYKPTHGGFARQDNTYGGHLHALMQGNTLEVKQGFSFMEALSQGWCERANIYKVYANGQEAATLVEDSECFNRCCCAPIHTYKVQYLGSNEGQLQKPEGGWASLNRPALMYREGCLSKCLCCFSLTDTCANHAEVLKMQQPNDGNTGGSQYTFTEKLCNGCTPEIVITEVASQKAIAMISGPSIFGGCYELCSDFDYTISSLNPDTMELGSGLVGDIATVVKKKPEGCCALFMEAMTDVDNFELHFNAQSEFCQDPQFRAVSLAALIYLDFMFFEYDNGICEPGSNGGCKITCFNCYCCGSICPCSFTCGGSSEGGE